MTTLSAAAGRESTPYSPSLLGPLGLNITPSAYMEAGGTIRAGLGHATPYTHGYLSVQVADALNVTLRQTAETSGLDQGAADNLYPGIDVKLRLVEEGDYMPEIALGLTGAAGHKRISGEYLALSRRFHDLTFTAGLGWGRYAGQGLFKNPFGIISDHFSQHRDNDGMMPNGPEDWFTGKDIGAFAGIEYATPVRGLDIKLDWGMDDYRAEKVASGFDAPPSWALGLNYRPIKNMDLGLGLIGGKTVMATLNIKGQLQNWPFAEKTAQQEKNNPDTNNTTALYKTRKGRMDAEDMQFDSARNGATRLYDIRSNKNSLWAKADLAPQTQLMPRFGQTIRNMANHAGRNIEELLLTPTVLGLNGPAIRIMRGDFERAIIHHQGSPQEIWRNAAIDAPIPPDLTTDSAYGLQEKRHKFMPHLSLILDLETSMSENDGGFIYRSGVIADLKHQSRRHWINAAALRLEGPGNPELTGDRRPDAFRPVRSDIADFADMTISVDRLYNAYLRSFANGQVHVMAASGYLENMYAGFGGEVLYRPHGKTYAFGAEAWQAFRRDPHSKWGLGLNGDHVLTGHLKTWYEIPQTDLTIGLRAGRYLGEDLGATFSLAKDMQNGVRIEAFATATNRADFDIFGGTTHLYSGLRLTLPLGNIPYIPQGSHARFKAAPLGRDMGQTLDQPLPLYDLTTPFSYRAIAAGWNDVTR